MTPMNLVKHAGKLRTQGRCMGLKFAQPCSKGALPIHLATLHFIINRQTDRLEERETDRQTDREMGRETDR